ncbi:MAG: transposase [Methylococcaceae bacterium]|nr:transposase [Methylococcaceae bacterium]MCI0666557.1 transposase [Methylococcaceae bacterium]MCI0732453.1 transposase [Methylococcaceae bacterium]
MFSTDSVTVYWIAYRSAEPINNLLGEAYHGWLISDGYWVYRKYQNRLRCWAHLQTTAITLDLFGRCHPQPPRRTCRSKSAGC